MTYNIIPLIITGALILTSFLLMLARCSSHAWDYAEGGSKERVYVWAQIMIMTATQVSFLGLLFSGPYTLSLLHFVIAALVVFVPVMFMISSRTMATSRNSRIVCWIAATVSSVFITYVMAACILGASYWTQASF